MMSEQISFTKMHGIGNDFVVIDNRKNCYRQVQKNSKLILDRHYGIGADQILLIEESESNYPFMRVYNSDGSTAEMCGNGIRAVAIYLKENDKASFPDSEIKVETDAGLIVCQIRDDNMVRVEMGSPILDGLAIPTVFDKVLINEPLKIGSSEYHITAVSMGNPHAVIFVDDVSEVDLAKEGALIENATSFFPNKINVEFVEVVSESKLKVRVWERGAGETLACGTGASASMVAASLNGKVATEATISLPGGDLQLEFLDKKTIFMTGPAVSVFSGTILVD
ncbi:MAG: diaminopimelate epimerase [Nitrospinota bacterium]